MPSNTDVHYDNENIFAKILNKEAPSINVYEDEKTLAFMDIMPQKDGHVLIIPKFPAVTLYDLPEDFTSACLSTVKRIGIAVEKAFGIDGSTVFQHNGTVAGQTVPHIHFHVFPGSILDVKGHAAEKEEISKLVEIAERIKTALAE